jgi:ferredoxin-NADP reductase
VKNLWLAGSWTYPGGGFTGAIISGFFAGMAVHGHLKKARKKTGAWPEGKAQERGLSQTARFLRKELVAKNTLELTFEKVAEFSYQPGQYAFMCLNEPVYKGIDMPVRSLSMVSHPDEKVLRFVMRESQSSFKKSCAALSEGDTATLYGPTGTFVLQPGEKGIVFLVAGIGISPVFPMLQELEKRRFRHPVYLFYSNRTQEEAAYHPQLGKIRMKEYHYTPIFSKTEGRMHKELLCRELSDPSAFEFYIVGSTEFIESSKGILQECLVPETAIHVDDFG